MLYPACDVLLDSKLLSVLLTQSAALCFSVHGVLVVAAGSVISLRCGAPQSIRYFAMGDFVRNGCVLTWPRHFYLLNCVLLAGRAIGCRISQLLVEWTNTFSVYLISKGEENLLPYIITLKRDKHKTVICVK